MIRRIIHIILLLRDRIARRLVNKLILLFTTIIILVVGLLSVISYQMIQEESVSYNIASTTNNLKLVNQNLEDYLGGIEQFSLPQIHYDEIIRAILREKNDYSSRMYLEDYLRGMFYSRNDLESIYLYIMDQHKYYSISREDYNITVRIGFEPGIPAEPWYKQAMASPHNRSFQSFIVPGAKSGYAMKTEPDFMGYHRVLRSIATRDPKAVLSFYFKPTVKDEILKDVPFEEGEHLLFLDSDNVPFHADDLEFYRVLLQENTLKRIVPDPACAQAATQAARPLTWTSEEGKRYLIVYNIGQSDGWKLVKPIPYSNIYAAATTTRNWSILIGFVFLLISVVLVMLISSEITKPLKQLSYQMRRFSEGIFDAGIQVKGQDEIAYLSRHFNKMVRRTHELINERYKMKLVEKSAILKALEAELNPHFLYNALQAISTKALKSGDDEVADMIDALAMTLRYCISGKDIVRASEELKHIGHYLALQQARYGSRLKTIVDWEDALTELQIPKLSIQSLLENSIKHAVEKVSYPVTIFIRAKVGDTHAEISVIDDGPGISADRIEELRAAFRKDWVEHDGGNIGLTNLNTRLKLIYGEAAGLTIRSDRNETEMLMRIPLGGNSHV